MRNLTDPVKCSWPHISNASCIMSHPKDVLIASISTKKITTQEERMKGPHFSGRQIFSTHKVQGWTLEARTFQMKSALKITEKRKRKKNKNQKNRKKISELILRSLSNYGLANLLDKCFGCPSFNQNELKCSCHRRCSQVNTEVHTPQGQTLPGFLWFNRHLVNASPSHYVWWC